MRKLAVSTFLLAVAVTLPLQARGKNESYISYDDGGTVVRQGDDKREIDARVNLPVFPGDEVITNRRGRTEIRLADGNVVAIDRASSLLLRSVLNSYDAESKDTIAELKYGKVIVNRKGDASQSFRLDTPSASYFAGNEAIYSVETDSHGRDHLDVFDGPVEVRTPSGTSRVKAGETAEVDERGLAGLGGDQQGNADDFERWFLQRSEKYSNSQSRYLDQSLAYSDEDLNHHGSWTFIGGFGWGWRPFVGVSWRPYYYGQWVTGPSGCLTWVSYEPWGWVPYHYGRWAYDGVYGWFWMPGAAYSPAWVYWMYSPGTIGWAPAGWYDCYRPYYDWAYRPYARAGVDIGFGFYGRVHMHDVDLRPWTFVDANTIVSGRVDRAALSTDLVRTRLSRGTVDTSLVTGMPARFGRNDLRDPAGAVNELFRRQLTGATGQVVPATDMTPFFRRDAALPAGVRDHIVRQRPVDSVGVSRNNGGTIGSVAPIGSGSIAPIGSGNLAPIGGGSVAPIGSGSVAPTNGGSVRRGNGNNNDTTTTPSRDNANNNGQRDSGGRINRGTGSGTKQEETWRDKVSRMFPGGIDSGTRPSTDPVPVPAHQDWRARVARDQGEKVEAGERTPATETPVVVPAPSSPPSGRSRSAGRSGSSDVPRRIIDGIGGTRIYRDNGEKSSSPPPQPRATESPRPARESSPPPPPPQKESAPKHDSGSRSEGGKVHRDKQ